MYFSTWMKSSTISAMYSSSYAWRPVIPDTTNSIIKNHEEEVQRGLTIIREKADDNKIKLRTI